MNLCSSSFFVAALVWHFFINSDIFLVSDPELARQFGREVCNGVPNKLTPGSDAEDKAMNAASMKFGLEKYRDIALGDERDLLNSSCLVDEEVYPNCFFLTYFQSLQNNWALWSFIVSYFTLQDEETGRRKSELRITNNSSSDSSQFVDELASPGKVERLIICQSTWKYCFFFFYLQLALSV